MRKRLYVAVEKSYNRVSEEASTKRQEKGEITTMDIEHRVYKLALSGKPIPQIAEILNVRVKEVRNIIDGLRNVGTLIASCDRPITRHYKRYTRGKS